MEPPSTAAVPQDVYRPRKDSYLLKEALEQEELGGKRVLDMGTGSGILAVTAARQGASVTAADINPRAVATVRQRARQDDLSIDAVRSDLFAAVSGTYDVIVFNPPYVPAARTGDVTDAAWASGSDGRAVLDRFIRAVGDALAAGGRVLLLQSSRNDVSRTRDALQREGFTTAVAAEEELHFETLAVLAAERGP